LNSMTSLLLGKQKSKNLVLQKLDDSQKADLYVCLYALSI
jgi:hypothetical protein